MTTHILCAFLAMFDETFVTDMGVFRSGRREWEPGVDPVRAQKQSENAIGGFPIRKKEWEQGLTPCGPRSSVKTWGFPIRKNGLGTGVDPVRAQKQSENATAVGQKFVKDVIIDAPFPPENPNMKGGRINLQ